MLPNCANCALREKVCRLKEGTGPRNCPTIELEEAISEALEDYKKDDVREFARQASIQEAECYANRDNPDVPNKPLKPRVLEICEFADKMGYERLGIAFCSGLTREARILSEVLENHGFEVASVVCKVGGTPKEKIEIKDSEKVSIGRYETMCSPIIQAEVLNEVETDFNIVLGLCVGHDSLFFQYSEAPTTVLAAKDRVLGHNPIAALYTIDSYYRYAKKPYEGAE